MKRILPFFLLGFSLLCRAQTDRLKPYALSNASGTTQLTSISLTDPYLSPLTYNGVGLGYSSRRLSFFRSVESQWIGYDKMNLEGAVLLNPQSTAAMLYGDWNYSWGLLRKLELKKDLRILLGGSWNVDAGVKYNDRNINNPVNMDLSTGLFFTGIGYYDIALKRKLLHLQLECNIPLAGVMFVPPAGDSYYEMFELGNLSDTFHFSSLHNKRGVDAAFTVDVPFRFTVWRFGLRWQYLKYKANDEVFTNNGVSLLVGTTFDFIRFAGKRHPAPDHFFSPEKSTENY